MRLGPDNTLIFIKQKKAQKKITFQKYMGETYILYTWDKQKKGVEWAHIFKCPVRFHNGLVIEWCDVEIPGIENHKLLANDKHIPRKIEILDSDWFNKLLNDFEKLD